MTQLYIRECAAQMKCIRRLMINLQDDLGDLSINRDLQDSIKNEFERMDSSIETMANNIETMQKRLEELSTTYVRGK